MNTCGVLFTAQAAGLQMARFERGGSIILIASVAGSVAVVVRNSSREYANADFAEYYRMASVRLFHIARRSLPCCKWPVAWHANWV